MKLELICLWLYINSWSGNFMLNQGAISIEVYIIIIRLILEL